MSGYFSNAAQLQVPQSPAAACIRADHARQSNGNYRTVRGGLELEVHPHSILYRRVGSRTCAAACAVFRLRALAAQGSKWVIYHDVVETNKCVVAFVADALVTRVRGCAT